MLQRNISATTPVTLYSKDQIMFSLFQLLVIAARDADGSYQAFDPFRSLTPRRDAKQ